MKLTYYICGALYLLSTASMAQETIDSELGDYYSSLATCSAPYDAFRDLSFGLSISKKPRWKEKLGLTVIANDPHMHVFHTDMPVRFHHYTTHTVALTQTAFFAVLDQPSVEKLAGEFSVPANPQTQGVYYRALKDETVTKEELNSIIRTQIGLTISSAPLAPNKTLAGCTYQESVDMLSSPQIPF